MNAPERDEPVDAPDPSAPVDGIPGLVPSLLWAAVGAAAALAFSTLCPWGFALPLP